MNPRPALVVAVAHESRVLAAVQAPSAEWLLARNSTTTSWPGDWRSWVLAQCGVTPADSAEWPAGPCVRASLDGRWPDGTWICATPVHLATGIDHLQLAPLDSTQLESGEAAALTSALDALLAARGLELQYVDEGSWVLRWYGPLQCTTVEPVEAVGRDVFDFMPAGAQGAKLRGLMNEIQMLLHDHPINEARTREGRLSVNALWLWGQGTAPARTRMTLPPLITDDAWLAGIWRTSGNEVCELDVGWSRAATGRARTVVALAHAPPETLEDAVFRPLREMSTAGELGHVSLLIDRRGFELPPRAALRFWRRSRPLSEWLE